MARIEKTGRTSVPRPTPRDERILRACFTHAHDLLQASESILTTAPHLAFHFALLAMEELGKKTIYSINVVNRLRGDVESISTKHLDDHVQKLYWAFFGSSIVGNTLDKAKLQQFRGLARLLHERRMLGLYVDTEAKPFRHPRRVIGRREATNLVQFARITFNLELHRPAPATNSPGIDSAIWLLEAGNDPDRRGFVFRDESLDKLRELGNYPDWIAWLRDNEVHEQESFNAFARADFERVQIRVDDSKPRWEVKCRFHSIDMNVQNKAIKSWNTVIPWAQVSLTGKTNQELLVTLTISDRVHVMAVYEASKALMERVLLSLNIGTLGFFWWDKSQLNRRFYESCTDLESGQPIIFTEHPATDVDFGMLAIKEDVMRHAIGLAARLPFPTERSQYEPFYLYLEGLSFFATVNVVRRHEHYAFQGFYRAYWIALERFLNVSDGDRTLDNFLRGVPHQFRENEAMRALFSKGEKLVRNEHDPDFEVNDVAWMKRIFDFFIITLASDGVNLRGTPTASEETEEVVAP